MPTSPPHPAYYACRRQLWATPPNEHQSSHCKWFRRMGLGNNCDTLSDVWYSVILLGTVICLTSNAIWRYHEFKAQAYNPRYGGQWNETTPLYFQLVVLLFSLSCFPVMLYSSTSKTGHFANDNVNLGMDIPHLQMNLLSLPVIQQVYKACTIPSENQPVSGGTLQRARSGSQTPNTEVNLDQFLLKRRGEGWFTDALDYVRPFSAVLFLMITYAYLLPVCVMEAEQLQNEAMDPSYVYHSNLDRIFGDHMLRARIRSRSHQHETQAIQEPRQSNLIHTADSTGLLVLSYSDDQPVPAQRYAVTPPTVSLEYTAFLLSLAFLTVRYAAPFFFTSRAFSLIFTLFTALSCMFLALDVATMAVLYKIAIVGHRKPGGWRQADDQNLVLDQNLSPLACILISAACLPIVLLNTAAIYSYGYEQYKRALVNYAQLLISDDLFSPTVRPRNEDSLVSRDSCNGTIPLNDVLQGNDLAVASSEGHTNNDIFTPGFPIAIAVTTKYWRRPSSTKSTGRTQTPITGQHYPSNASEASLTLKRNRPSGTGNSDLNGSIHTLTDIKDMGRLESNKRYRHLGRLLVAGTTFFAFLVARICLAGPVIRCYWKTGLHLALFDMIFTVLYMIIWLLIWFGLGVKSAWRFRLLHSTPFNWPLQNKSTLVASELPSFHFNSNTFPNLQYQQLQQQPQLTYAGGLWPYFTHQPWLPTSQSAMVGACSENSRNATPLANTSMMAIRETAGSAQDSLYGCFADNVQVGQEQQQNNSHHSHYQLHGIGLRTGPPTVSDDSELQPAAEDQNNMPVGYFHPIPGTAGQTQINPSHYTAHQQYNTKGIPFTDSLGNQTCESSSRETSPIDPPSLQPTNKGIRPKGSKVAATLSLLQQGQMKPSNVTEPTYATLAKISGGNCFQPPSVNSVSAENNTVPNTAAPFRQGHNSVRRVNSRVTFRDPTNSLHVASDVATGSSDSGVYTNGHNGDQKSINLYDPRVSRQGRLKPENFKLFAHNTDQPSQFNGRMTPNTGHQQYYYNFKQASNSVGLDENQMSTDLMTDFTGEQKHMTPKAVGSELFVSQKLNSTLSTSNEHLCSQV